MPHPTITPEQLREPLTIALGLVHTAAAQCRLAADRAASLKRQTHETAYICAGIDIANMQGRLERAQNALIDIIQSLDENVYEAED